MSDDRQLVDFDEAFVRDDGRLVVVGSVPAGSAVCLTPRRYKSPPPWAGIEVMAVAAAGAASGTGRFALSLDLTGLWGVSGIEVVGSTAASQIPRPEPDEV